MNWKKLLPWSKTTSTPTSLYKSFDQKLLQKTQDRTIPRWSQLKYISRFFTQTEKIIIQASIAVACLSALALFTLFLNRHIMAVPKEGGTYTEALIGQPKYINPLFSSTNDVDADLTSLVYSGLFHYNDKRQLTPDLADSYTISQDKRVYDVKIRHDVRWSDGEPFTADDVLFTFELIQNPEVGSPLFSAFQGIKVEKISDDTIRFTLSQPFAPFVQSLTNGILPEHIWSGSNPTNIRLAKTNTQPIGTGPWQFSKLLKDEGGTVQSYTLTRNENYYGTKPYLKTITFNFFYDPGRAADQAIEALRSKTVDGVSFVAQEQKKKINPRSFTTYELHIPQYTALFFNQNQATLLKDDATRLALAEAIDKNDLIKAALETEATPLDGPFVAGASGITNSTTSIHFSIDNANAVLDKKWTRIKPEEYYTIRHDALFKAYQNNWKDINNAASSTATMSDDEKNTAEKTISDSVRQEMDVDQQFYRRDKNNNVLTLTITTVDTPEYRAVAEWIAKTWEKIGVKTLIKTVDNRQITREVLRNRSYEILLYGEITSLDPDPFPFWHSSQTDYPGLNLAGFANRNADKLLEEARTTLDTTKRTELYSTFQDILNQEIPAIFLYAPTHSMVLNTSIKGVNPTLYLNNPSDRFNDLTNWYIKTKWKWK